MVMPTLRYIAFSNPEEEESLREKVVAVPFQKSFSVQSASVNVRRPNVPWVEDSSRKTRPYY
jgi:hypothetical protein